MLKTFFIITQIAISIFLYSCSSSNDNSSFNFGIGKYKFTMWDSTGKKLLEGTLEVKTFSNEQISGTYEFKKIYYDKFPGFNSMNGQFDGNIDNTGKKIFINTNPKIADSNIFWNLTIKRTLLSGQWNYSTLRGTVGKGKVKITE